MILAGPFDAVFYVCRNENVVALGQNLDFGLAFETQSGRSGQDHNPFGPGRSYQNPGGLFWPHDTIRSILTWRASTRQATCSSRMSSGAASNRLPDKVSI